MSRTPEQLGLAFAGRLRAVKELFVDRDEVVDLLALGALCGEHVLVVGPPGTAKSRLLTRFCRLLDTEPFSYLLTRFTEPAEIFGSIDVKEFQDNSVYKVNTAGMLPEARIAHLDEVFRGSSAILNTLLTLINERTFHTGQTSLRCPLITLVGSANDIPDDPELAAFSDRFLLRCTVDHVGDDAIEDLLELGWQDEQDRIRAAGQTGDGGDDHDRDLVPLTAPELATLQQAVAKVDLTPVRGPYAKILQALRSEGVTFSDRRAVKAQKVFAASALLRGGRTAEEGDLARLVHLWTDARDEATIRRIAADSGIPVDEPGGGTRDPVLIGIDLREIGELRARAATGAEIQRLAQDNRRLANEVRRHHPGEPELLRAVEREQTALMTRLRELDPDRWLS
ncbi:AAA family ATPase [Actinomadura graeca]|uniref:AAA family ATPase n=1 Tax=Actinomadura graeca TaxID=2750812 RepID=A0ABX8QNE5_9ACTN|nr:AAA family ATPase [Actinomadura graeca]QXJ20207.1 AAA family ATPase [Actinomadura graeca]